MFSRFFLVLLVSGLSCGCGIPSFTAKQDVTQTIPLEGQKSLEVSTFNGSIQITENTGNEIELVAHITSCGYTQKEADDGLALLEPKLATDTGNIQIKVVRESSNSFWGNGVELELKVPRNLKTKLSTSNGKISCEGREADVEAKTSNGEIELVDIHANVNAKTSNGRIQASLVKGTIQLDTSNGFIKLKGCQFIGENMLETSNGSIVVALEPQDPIEFSAKTSNGDVRCVIKESQLTQEKSNRMQGLLYPGEGKSKSKVTVQTSNGNVTFENVPESSKLPSNKPGNEDVARPEVGA